MSTETMTRPSTTKATLKRKVGYVDEEASATRTKFARMEITREGEIEDEPTPSTISKAHNLSLPPS